MTPEDEHPGASAKVEPKVVRPKPERLEELGNVRRTEIQTFSNRLGRMSKWRWDRFFSTMATLFFGGAFGGFLGLIAFPSSPTTTSRGVYITTLIASLVLAIVALAASLAIKDERADSVMAIKDDLDELLDAYD